MAGARLVELVRDRSGASALEFAIFAPLLILGLLTMVDVGLAIGTRMELDRIVRSGAQAAMSLNNDADAIEAIVLASTPTTEGLSVAVERTCSCAEIAAACTAVCDGGEAPSVYYAIGAERTHAGMILGERQLVSNTRIQIR